MTHGQLPIVLPTGPAAGRQAGRQQGYVPLHAQSAACGSPSDRNAAMFDSQRQTTRKDPWSGDVTQLVLVVLAMRRRAATELTVAVV